MKNPTSHKILASVILLLIFGFAGQLAGQNLIQGGTFPSIPVDVQYWTNFGVPNHIVNDADGNGGLVMLDFEKPMTQTVPTVAGTTYQLTFAMRAPQPPEFNGPVGPNGPIGPWQVKVLLNGTPSGLFENDSQTTWEYFSMDFQATGPTTLGFQDTVGWPLFDDASLVAVVPEPAFPAYFFLAGVFVVSCRGRRTIRQTLLGAGSAFLRFRF